VDRPAPSGLAAAFATVDGRVAAFDDGVGAGRVRAEGTGEEWYFHCTRIADGTRTIAVGAEVRFEVVPGPTGLEAVAIRRRT
jgi:cold shock CspA family protein